jgi:E3 ubiquitin-protein ligase RNF14
MPDLIYCRRPGCPYGQIHDSEGGNNIFICRRPGCGFKLCVTHDVEIHEGETCEEYDRRISGAKAAEEEEKANIEAIKKLTKKCPNETCGWNIEKITGCDHMTCELSTL